MFLDIIHSSSVLYIYVKCIMVSVEVLQQWNVFLNLEMLKKSIIKTHLKNASTFMFFGRTSIWTQSTYIKYDGN